MMRSIGSSELKQRFRASARVLTVAPVRRLSQRLPMTEIFSMGWEGSTSLTAKE